MKSEAEVREASGLVALAGLMAGEQTDREINEALKCLSVLAWVLDDEWEDRPEGLPPFSVLLGKLKAAFEKYKLAVKVKNN